MWLIKLQMLLMLIFMFELFVEISSLIVLSITLLKWLNFTFDTFQDIFLNMSSSATIAQW